MDAIAKSKGQPTKTWSGAFSQLDPLWTPEAEEMFTAMGGDVLNEQLGYPRHYAPDLYPDGAPVISQTQRRT